MKLSLLASALLQQTSGQGLGLVASGPTSRGYQESLPHCGKPRFHHNVNLFFELPDERKRRSTSFSKDESKTSVDVPVERSNGNRNWFDQSKRDIRKVERTTKRKEKKGKMPSSHLQSQRLIGGQEAIPHSWPWQVFVKIEGKAGGYDCGGSIISEKWILTAAHCVPYRPVPAMSYVYAGIHRIHTGPKQKLKVKRVIVHSQYGFPILDNNDIALVELEKPLVFSPQIQPLCLPDPSICLPHGMKCAATGWGVTDKFGTQIPDALNEVAVRLIEKEQCENIHSDYQGQLSDEMLCAGYKEGGRDACLGDSGGPLACQIEENGPYVLYGITSWGIGCGDPLHPGVYTRVTALMDWVKEHTGIGPAISGGDFPQHQCAGQSAAPLIPTGDDATPPPSVAVTANKPLTSRKDQNKQQVAVSTNSGPAEFDLQGLIDSEIEEVGTCGGSTDLRSGSLRSPGYGKKYPTDIKCLWQVKPEVSENEWIQIEFKKSDFGKCADKGFRYNAKPKGDYIAVLDEFGQVVNNRSICRTSNGAPLYVFAKGSASLFMSSDENVSDNGKGFRMRFQTLPYEPSKCGDKRYQTLESDETIHVSSMNWPNRYLAGTDCNWNIEAPIGHQLVVDIDMFDIGGVKNKCDNIYASVTDNGDGAELGRFCGKLSKKYLANKKMTSTSNKIEINFVAGNNAPKRGFRFKIRAVPMDSVKSQRALSSTETTGVSNEVIISRIEKLLTILKARLGFSEAK